MKTKKIVLVNRPPSVAEYQILREAVGWSNRDTEATEVGLSHALFSVCVLHHDKVIGCGRVIGDGGIYFYIQDIIVLPDYQGQGIGKRLMEAVTEYLDEQAPEGAFVGLMAAKDVSKFYERYGFQERASDKPGMFCEWQKSRKTDRAVKS